MKILLPMETVTVRDNFSQQVTKALHEQGRSKKWLYEQLQTTAPTLDSRIKNNDWRLGEIMTIIKLLGLK